MARELSDEGTAILLITSDMPEMITLADRIVVMNDYLVMGELPNTRDYTEMSEGIWNSSTKQKKLQRVPFRLRHKTSRKSCRIEPHVRLY